VLVCTKSHKIDIFDAFHMADPHFITQTLNGKLNEFFPPDHPNTPWLLRLMVIRDDVHFELSSIQEHIESAQSWKVVYYLRRISVSLLEANCIFGHNFRIHLEWHQDGKKGPVDPLLLDLMPLFQEAISKVTELSEKLKGLRDSIGAHLRPDFAVKGGRDVIKTVLENHPKLDGDVKILGRTDDVSYRGLSVFAPLFAWPDVDDDEKVVSRMREFNGAVLGASRAVNHAIDGILAHHWNSLGLIHDTADAQLTRVDKDNPDVYHPVRPQISR
jgi:hypothetical protein